MSRYIIEIEVNDAKLRRYEGIDVDEENDYEQCVESLIMKNTLWNDDCGIYFISINESPQIE